MKNAFEKIVLPVFGIFGTLITFLTFIFPSYANIRLSLSIYVITILVLLLAITILIKLIIDLRYASFNKTFNNFRISPIQYVESENILLINKAILLPLNCSITVYAQEGLFEKAIALGFVSHIQEQFIQVKVFAFLEKSQQISQIELKNLILRPTSNVNEIIQLVAQGATK